MSGLENTTKTDRVPVPESLHFKCRSCTVDIVTTVCGEDCDLSVTMGTGHRAARVGRCPALGEGRLREEACVRGRETCHISDEVFTPSLPSSENWSHEIPFLFTFRYGNAKHS